MGLSKTQVRLNLFLDNLISQRISDSKLRQMMESKAKAVDNAFRSYSLISDDGTVDGS